MPTAFPSVSPVPQTLPLIPASSAEALEESPAEQDALAQTSTKANSNRASTNEMLESKIFHRLAEVRAQQGLSLRTISRRTGLDVKELRRQEQPSYNLTLSQLRVWQKALEVPLVDLLEDDSDVLSRPVKERAQMVRIMKTVVSLNEVCQTNLRLSRLTTMLREQMLQLMPELGEIGGWPQCGSRRGPDVMGRIFHDPVRVEFDGD